MSSSRPLEHLVLLSISTTGSYEEGEEASTVLLAWLIHNVSNNKTMSQEEVYVLPQEGAPPTNALPPGISAASLKDACSLETALKKLHESLTKLAGTTFSIMVSGPGPLRQFLHPEARRLGLTLQSYLCHYLDLNKEMRVTYPSAPFTTDLDKMAEFLSIECATDSPRVGQVELLLFCKIVTTLISEGHVFQKLEVVKQFDNSKTLPNRPDVKSDAVLSLKGLPYQASVDDVAGFLAGLNIIPGGIAFGTNQMGRRTGGAVVVTETAEQAELGLERNRHYIGPRYVEVSLGSPDDFWQIAEVETEDATSDGVFVVRMTGLPYRATVEEVVEFFADGSATVMSGKEGVLLLEYPDGRASGDGYALFSSDADFKAALELHKQKIPNYSRYVDLSKSSAKDIKAVLSASGTSDQQARFSRILGTPISTNPEIEALRGKERDCVKLRGLPFDSKPDDVLAFFGSLKDEIASKGVHMVLNANNKPTGDCYVQMKSEDSAKKASTDLNKEYIGSRYIEVFQCSGDEVARVLMEKSIGGGYRSDRRRGGGGRREGGGGGGGGFSNSGGGSSGFGGGASGGGFGGGDRGGDRRRKTSGGFKTVVKARGLPFKVEISEVADFFAEYDVTEGDVEMLYSRDGDRFLGIALVNFSSMQVAEDAIREKNKKYLGSRYIELSLKYE